MKEQSTHAVETAVTSTITFCAPEGEALFSVNAGIPIDVALEQVAMLLGCVESLTINDGDSTAVQYLAEMARAVVEACRGDSEEGAD